MAASTKIAGIKAQLQTNEEEISRRVDKVDGQITETDKEIADVDMMMQRLSVAHNPVEQRSAKYNLLNRLLTASGKNTDIQTQLQTKEEEMSRRVIGVDTQSPEVDMELQDISVAHTGNENTLVNDSPEVEVSDAPPVEDWVGELSRLETASDENDRLADLIKL